MSEGGLHTLQALLRNCVWRLYSERYEQRQQEIVLVLLDVNWMGSGLKMELPLHLLMQVEVANRQTFNNSRLSLL